MHNTITVHGSHGGLTVHRSTGYVIAADSCDCDDCRTFGDYTGIMFFDPARWPAHALEHGCTDILYTAFVDAHGYCRELSLIGDDELYLWDVPLLPAPAKQRER